jgi:hypothetical protein
LANILDEHVASIFRVGELAKQETRVMQVASSNQSLKLHLKAITSPAANEKGTPQDAKKETFTC